MALTENPKLAMIPSGYGDYKVYSVLPSDGTGDFDFVRSSGATRVNKSGLIETVGFDVPRLNYPMIDGVVSGCPSLLLEPQRSNIVTYSEDFSQSSWIKLNGTVNSNTAISVDGSINADFFIPNTTSGIHALRSNIFNQSSTASHSWFVKANGYTKVAIRESELVGNYASFDLSTGSIISTNQTGSIVNFGNGWYRLTLVDTTNGAEAQTSIVILPESYSSGDPLINWSGDGVKGVYVFGTQVEIGGYPTSYIPTNGEVNGVTRSAETCNGAGDAATFNDSEGVLMAEISALDNLEDGNWISINDGGLNNRILIGYVGANAIRFILISGTFFQVDFSKTIASRTSFNKVAFKWALNDCSFWINGIKVDADTSATMPIGLAQLSFNDGATANFKGNTKQIQYFDTALTDTDLEELTSWTSFNEMAISQQYSLY